MEPSENESAKRRKVEVWYVKDPMIMQNSEYDDWILLEDQDSQVLVPPSYHDHTGSSSSGTSSTSITVEAQPDEGGNVEAQPEPGSPVNQ